MTDAAVGDAQEGMAGQRAGVSRPALHLNVELNLAGEEEQNWWMNMEKLSPSLGSPPPEPCELLEASPETPVLLFLLLLLLQLQNAFLQTGDCVDISNRLPLRDHVSSCFVNLRIFQPVLTVPSHCGYNALKCAPVSGGSSLAFRGGRMVETGDTPLTDRH